MHFRSLQTHPRAFTIRRRVPNQRTCNNLATSPTHQTAGAHNKNFFGSNQENALQSYTSHDGCFLGKGSKQTNKQKNLNNDVNATLSTDKIRTAGRALRMSTASSTRSLPSVALWLRVHAEDSRDTEALSKATEAPLFPVSIGITIAPACGRVHYCVMLVSVVFFVLLLEPWKSPRF